MAVLAVAGCTPGVTVPARPPTDVDSAPGRVAEITSEHVLAGSLHGGVEATLTLRDAASYVEVRLVELPGLLYRVSTPATSGLAPRVTGPAGRVWLRLAATGGGGPDTVTILLNRAVRWDIRLPAGAGEQHLDLAAGRVARLDLGAGAGLVDVRLPRPEGSIPVTVTGAIGSLALAAPPGTPIRLRLRAGAGTVAAPRPGTGTAAAVPASGEAAAGQVLVAGRWRSGGDRYAIDARERIDLLALRS